MSLTKVLVTGGSGFIGSHLVDYLLERGIETHIVDKAVPRKEEHRSLLVGQEAFLFDKYNDYDAVFHLAGLTSVPESMEYPEEYLNANLALTQHVSRESKKVFFASSAAANDVTSVYGLTKKLAEPYCYASFRFYNVFGPGATGGVIHEFISRMLSGKTVLIYGDGGQTRDFIYVKELVSRMVSLALEDRPGIHHLGNGLGISINLLIDLLKKIAPLASFPVEYLPEREGDIAHSKCSYSWYDPLEALIYFKKYLRETVEYYRPCLFAKD